jgi:glycerophosphoryl diester phosphodiesterase
VNLWRGDGRPLVIGHRGAAAVAPENTVASLEAAVAAGVDVVEFDISPGLRLGHSPDELPDEELRLDDALELLKPRGVGLHLDVKERGYEAEVLAAIRRHGLGDRAYCSTAFAASARRLAGQGVPVAIGYPRDRLGISGFRWPEPLTRSGSAALRQAMPARVPLLLRWARAEALSLHHTLCSPAAVRAAHRLGAPVLAWTVNDPEGVRRVTSAGVDGIVSDDPEMTVATLLAL